MVFAIYQTVHHSRILTRPATLQFFGIEIPYAVLAFVGICYFGTVKTCPILSIERKATAQIAVICIFGIEAVLAGIVLIQEIAFLRARDAHHSISTVSKQLTP